MKNLSQVIKNPFLLTAVQLLAFCLFVFGFRDGVASVYLLLWSVGLVAVAVRTETRATRVICSVSAGLILLFLAWAWLF